MSEFVFSPDEAAVMELLRARGLATVAQLSVLALLPPSSVRTAVERLRDVNLLSDGEPLALTRRGTQVFDTPMKVSAEANVGAGPKPVPEAPPTVTVSTLDDTSRIRLKASDAVVMPAAMQEDDQTVPMRPEVTP